MRLMLVQILKDLTRQLVILWENIYDMIRKGYKKTKQEE